MRPGDVATTARSLRRSEGSISGKAEVSSAPAGAAQFLRATTGCAALHPWLHSVAPSGAKIGASMPISNANWSRAVLRLYCTTVTASRVASAPGEQMDCKNSLLQVLSRLAERSANVNRSGGEKSNQKLLDVVQTKNGDGPAGEPSPFGFTNLTLSRRSRIEELLQVTRRSLRFRGGFRFARRRQRVRRQVRGQYRRQGCARRLPPSHRLHLFRFAV